MLPDYTVVKLSDFALSFDESAQQAHADSFDESAQQAHVDSFDESAQQAHADSLILIGWLVMHLKSANNSQVQT